MEINPFNDEYFMKEALKEAKYAMDEGEVPVGAVVVCNDRIIARAHNQTEALQDTTAHAEMIAMTSAANYLGSKYLDECTLYVTLEPCNMCGGALYWGQLKKLVFAASDEKRGYTRIVQGILHPKTEVVSGVLASQSEVMLQDFFSRLRERK